jgi:hypothetical protein
VIVYRRALKPVKLSANFVVYALLLLLHPNARKCLKTTVQGCAGKKFKHEKVHISENSTHEKVYVTDELVAAMT